MVGDIFLFGGNFAMNGHAFCEGQSLSVSSNQALFKILGTKYGGDGTNTFNLPNLKGKGLDSGTSSGPRYVIRLS